ncbi:23S rRNA (guanosine(2251)-2'-O)-methyltransferase RlmB [Francisellaceae bacterium]|nr:23S rRNA (guanosine(2251)-2'-O)-methyltransferase RlmB [Francisellaceae bacterium]
MEPDSVQTLFMQFGRESSPKHKELVEIAKYKKVSIKWIDKKDLDKKSPESVHQGAILSCLNATKFFEESDIEVLLSECEKPPFILILDCVQDPHNFGACLRSADAAGVDFVIFPKDKSAPLSAVVRKVSCGASESVKLVSVTNLARAMRMLKDQGVWLAGLAGETDETTIYDLDLKDSIGIVMGSEGDGLRRNTKNMCDYLVKLPMNGAVSSLNVSVATGVALYEVLRQRGFGG